MKTIPVGYCGRKDREEDHLYGTGLVWLKGVEGMDVHEVPIDKAGLLLGHPDVWFDARVRELRANDPVPILTKPSRQITDPVSEQDSVPPANFGDMGRAQIDEFVLKNFGIEIPKALDVAAARIMAQNIYVQWTAPEVKNGDAAGSLEESEPDVPQLAPQQHVEDAGIQRAAKMRAAKAAKAAAKAA